MADAEKRTPSRKEEDCLPQNSHLFHFLETPGPYSVGLKVEDQYDYSRTYRCSIDELGMPYQGERARPLQTLIWYPSEHSAAQPMTVADYVDLWSTETSFGKKRVPARAREWLSGMSPTLALQLWAVRDASVASGEFPAVIYAPSFSSPSWENADICEYIASHGYVVLASPSMGERTRNMTGDLAGINAQARDISFLVGYSQTLPNTLVSGVAVAGFSWGGISNLFAAARDNRIDALIALDGSLRFSPGLVRRAGDVDPQQMSIPLLSIAQGQWTPEERALLHDRYPEHAGPDVLNAWTCGDLITVHMLGLSHMEHSSMFQRNEDVWWSLFNVYKQKKADYGRADGIVGYAWLARYALEFLNAYLKHSPTAMTFLRNTPAENGAPRHYMAVNYRAAAGPPATFEYFRAEVGRDGFDRAADVYTRFQKQSSDFKLDEEELHAWADELVDGNRLSEAIAIHKLNVQLNPDSCRAHTSLGVAYQSAGRTSSAIDTYKRALEKDSGDADARRRLMELQR